MSVTIVIEPDDKPHKTSLIYDPVSFLGCLFFRKPPFLSIRANK
jgi:hypothetical protein